MSFLLLLLSCFRGISSSLHYRARVLVLAFLRDYAVNVESGITEAVRRATSPTVALVDESSRHGSA